MCLIARTASAASCSVMPVYNSRSGAIEDTDHFHREISARRALMTGSVLHCTALYWFKNNGGAGTRKVCVLRDGTRDKRRPMGRAARGARKRAPHLKKDWGQRPGHHRPLARRDADENAHDHAALIIWPIGNLVEEKASVRSLFITSELTRLMKVPSFPRCAPWPSEGRGCASSRRPETSPP
jgi:hypothetical protein